MPDYLYGQAATDQIADQAIVSQKIADQAIDSEKVADSDSLLGAIPVVFSKAVNGTGTINIHNANAPFKYQILQAWAIETSSVGSTWKLTDGVDDITDTVPTGVLAGEVTRASVIDLVDGTIPEGGTLNIVIAGGTFVATVYVLAIRVA